MRLLLVELEGEGHNMVLYTRLLLREIKRRGWSATLLTTASGRQHPAFDVLASEPQGPPNTIVIPDIAGFTSAGSVELLLSQVRIWRALHSACQLDGGFAQYDLVYCINMDKFEKAIALMGSPFARRPFAGMLTNPKFHREPLDLGPRSRSDHLYKTLFKRLLRLPELKCVTVIDELFQEYCIHARLPHADKIRAVPDVGELASLDHASSARRDFGIPDTAFVLLLYGSLSKRKGVAELLRAIESIHSDDVVALIAGRADAEIEALVDTPRYQAMKDQGRLFVQLRFHDDIEEARLFAAADVVWLGYVGGAYGSSGVLFQAGSAGLPVISMELGLIGFTVREHDAGFAVDPRDTARVASAIKRLRDDPELRTRLGRNGYRLSQRHTGSDFAGSVCLALQAVAGGSQDDAIGLKGISGKERNEDGDQ
jgi:glycosyltransferase involved in cell wall biosynthesis